MDDLRDQFAMAAMQGLLNAGIKDRELVASAAYEQADAMIAEHEKKSGNVVLPETTLKAIYVELSECKQLIQDLQGAKK